MRPRDRLSSILLITLLLAEAAFASPLTLPADLPPAPLVLRALASHPEVRAAQAMIQAAEWDRERLKVGPHEYGLRASSQRRNIDGSPASSEWQLAIERGVRLPQKARLDEGIGEALVEETAERVGEARHEVARSLIGLWYATLRGQAQAAVWRRQVALLEEDRRLTQTLSARGEASRLEVLQAEAALSVARSQAGQAEALAEESQASLLRQFPELPPARLTQDAPRLPEGNEASWIERALEHNHELASMQRALARARLEAQRADAERMPDPTVGLFVANEQRSSERIVGFSVSIPIGGVARRAQAGARDAQAAAMAERESATRRRLTSEIATLWQRAVAGVANHARLREASQAASRHAQLVRRGRQLGEFGLSEMLLADRQALEAELNAERARVEANESVARLALDSHQLWLPEPDAEHR